MARHLPNDPRVVDEVFSMKARPNHEDIGWLMGMVATFGRTPEQLEGFTWNDDDSINIKTNKRPLRPLHPQWVFLFQLKEKQPSRMKSRWSVLSSSLNEALADDKCHVSLEGLIFSYKVRKIYYTSLKRQKRLSHHPVAC